MNSRQFKIGENIYCAFLEQDWFDNSKYNCGIWSNDRGVVYLVKNLGYKDGIKLYNKLRKPIIEVL